MLGPGSKQLLRKNVITFLLKLAAKQNYAKRKFKAFLLNNVFTHERSIRIIQHLTFNIQHSTFKTQHSLPMGYIPSLSINARSRSASGLPVVRSLSP